MSPHTSLKPELHSKTISEFMFIPGVVGTYIYIYICMCVCICMCVYMAFVYVHRSPYVYIDIYIYISNSIHRIDNRRKFRSETSDNMER